MVLRGNLDKLYLFYNINIIYYNIYNMDIDNEFDESWNDTSITIINNTIINSKQDNNLILETNDIISDIDKKEILLKNAKKLLEDFDNRGIKLQGITENDIIEKWDDLYLLGNANPDKMYINNLIKSILEFGYFTPRPIQCITTGLINRGNDLVAQAVAGNGKTAAFVIGSLTRIELNLYKPQVLILSPTHELTDQTTEVVKNLSLYTGIVVHSYRGGLKLQKYGKVPQVIVACPGRLEDLINKNQIDLNYLKTLILDEGDELLKRGFKEQVKKIIESIIDTVQICLFSATYSKGILEMCNKFMRDPSYVILPDNQVMTSLVSQWYIKVIDIPSKLKILIDIIKNNSNDIIIIFFNYCSKLILASEELTKLNIEHLFIHGRLATDIRMKNLNDFINKKSNILLASDLAARGLDIPHVSLVINFDVAISIETYIHRIGRAGRGNVLGNAITLIVSEEDQNKMKYIVQMHSMPIKALKDLKLNK